MMLCDKWDVTNVTHGVVTNTIWQMQCDICNVTNAIVKNAMWQMCDVKNTMWQMQCDKCNMTNAIWWMQCEQGLISQN